MPIKIHPDYTGVDPRAQPIVNEYVWLSKQNHLDFDKPVTIGFKKINYKTVIGLCTNAWRWREIDLDIDYWNNSSYTSHVALLFHELTHCYCGRIHDYADGKKYPENTEDRIKDALDWFNKKGPTIPGYLEDGCPSTFMYPEILDDSCTLTHYDYYIHEMFDRCDPW